MFRFLGLARPPACPDDFWAARARPKPNLQSPKARRAFSGRKSADFWPNSGWIWAKLWDFLQENFFSIIFGFFWPKLTDFRPNSGQIMGFFVTEFFFNFFPKFLNKKIGVFYALKKPEPARSPIQKSPARPRPDTLKPEPARSPKNPGPTHH